MTGLESSVDLMGGRCGVGPMQKLALIWSDAVETKEAETSLIRLAQKVGIGRKRRLFWGKFLECSHSQRGIQICLIQSRMFHKGYQL
jgi:hypothetical protein